MKKLVVDLDGTLTINDSTSYENKTPNMVVIEQLRKYSKEGFYITIATARNMRTFEGNVGKINAHTLPIAIEWLKKYDVPYDEIIVGKPWCGFDGFYIDDKAIRPSEFVEYSYEEINEILKKEEEINLQGS